jgi:hypothetical protein
MNDPPFENDAHVKNGRKSSFRTRKPPESCNDSGFPVSGHSVPPELMVIIDFLAEKTAKEHILGNAKTNK